MERKSNFELLRLLAMFFIVVEHLLFATTLYTQPALSTIDNVSRLIEAFCICAVNIFFLLSGYFLKEEIKISRLVNLYIRMWIYCVGIYLIFCAVGYTTFNIGNLVKHILPITFNQYWFMQTYFLLALLGPYISKMLNSLNKKEHLILVLILLVFFSLHQTISETNNTLDKTQGYGIIWGIVLVVVGNYIKKYGDQFINKINMKWFLISYIIISVLIFLSNYLIVKYNIAQGIDSRNKFYNYNSLTVFAQSVSLLCIFIKINMKQNKLINRLSKNVISGYLILSQVELTNFLWDKFRNFNSYPSSMFLYTSILLAISLVILLICIVIDKFLIKLMRLKKLDNLLESKYGISKN